MTEEPIVRIVIVEDDKVIREGYRFLIGEKQGYHVVNTYSTAEQAIAKLQGGGKPTVFDKPQAKWTKV